MIASLFDVLVSDVVSAIGREEAVDATALRVLIRRYATTGDAEIGELLALELAKALDARPGERLDEWLHLWCEAAAVSDDERLSRAAAEAVNRLTVEWGRPAPVDAAMRSVAACLAAVPLSSPGLLQAGIDELERLVGAHYEPGEGMCGAGLAGQLESAAALLAAYEATARLPYAMLAEELARFARRMWWSDLLDGFDDPDPFAAAVGAARVWCRLAAVQADAVYRASAVPAPEAAWLADADRLLGARAAEARTRGIRAAAYALALADWIALQKEVE